MSIKIPVRTQKPLESSATSPGYGNLDFRNDGTRALQQGIGQASQGFEAIDAAKQDRIAKAKAQAEAISFAEADAELQRRATIATVGDSASDSFTLDLTAPAGSPEAEAKRKTGYFSTRGKAAFEASGAVLEQLEKDRQDVANGKFADPGARAKWLAKSSGTMADLHRQVEHHAAAQTAAAAQDALRGKLATSLQAIANDQDGSSTQALADDAEKAIRELALTKEGGDAAAEAWKRDVVGTRIDALLGQGQVDLAEGQFKAARDVLGAKADEYSAKIAHARKTADVARFDIEAQSAVDSIIAKNVTHEGQPNLAGMDAMLLTVPPGKLRDEMQQRLPAAKEMAAKRWKEKVDGYANAAGATYEKTLNLGAVDPKVKGWLIDYAPDEWRKLRHDAEQHTSHLRAARTGDAAARRDQTDIDRLARLEFLELPPAERASTDVGAFLRGRGVSPIGASTVRGEQTKAAETMRAGDAQGETEFVRKFEASTRGLAADGKAGDAKRKDLRAAAVDAYADLRAKNKGLKPSSEDVATELDRLAVKAATEPRFLDSVRGKGVETEVERMAREKKAALKDKTPTSQKDAAALEWARKNPDDPRSAAILKKLGVK